MGPLSIPFVLVAVLVLLVLAGKSEDDPRRERPAALYLSFLTLVGVLLLLAGTFLAANGMVELTDTTPNGWTAFTGEQGIEIGPDGGIIRSRPRFIGAESRGNVNHDDDVSQLVGGLIVVGIAVGLLRYFLPKLQTLADDSVGPGARVYSRLLYVVSGITLLSGLAAAGSALYAVYGMIAPDTAGAGRVTDAFRSLITALAVAGVAGVLFREASSKSEDLAAVANPTFGFASSEPPVVDDAPAPAKKAARPRKAAPPTE